MNTCKQLALGGALALFAPFAMSADVVGEWSNEPDNCDDMRVVYAEDGHNPTLVNADGDWVEVSESSWERDDNLLYVQTGARQDVWDIERLDDEELHLVNQDPEAADHGAGEARFYRCDPR